MRTGDTKCFGCNQGYLNCYQTCPNSPARNNDISLTPIQTSNLGQCDNGYKREMHIKADVAREIFEEIERFLYMHFRFCKEEIGNDDTEYIKGRLEMNTQIQSFIAELKNKYTENME